MFQHALLESSPAMRRRNAWPMATAFTLELVMGSILVLLPLLSTGVLQFSNHVIIPMPPRYAPVETHPAPAAANSRSVSMPSRQVVRIANTNPLLANRYANARVTDASDNSPNPHFNLAGSASGTDLPIAGQPILPARPERVTLSHSLEAMLINKVVPEYPRIARIAGVEGDVKLHAIIARDGTIQSLTVTSGPDMLRDAAIQAVRQWRYRPYVLDGAVVEVETVITVSFKKNK